MKDFQQNHYITPGQTLDAEATIHDMPPYNNLSISEWCRGHDQDIFTRPLPPPNAAFLDFLSNEVKTHGYGQPLEELLAEAKDREENGENKSDDDAPSNMPRNGLPSPSPSPVPSFHHPHLKLMTLLPLDIIKDDQPTSSASVSASSSISSQNSPISSRKRYLYPSPRIERIATRSCTGRNAPFFMLNNHNTAQVVCANSSSIPSKRVSKRYQKYGNARKVIKARRNNPS